MNETALLTYCREAGISCRREEPMKNYTTFRVGGPANWMLAPETEEQLSGLLAFLEKDKIQPFFLGRGSNLLVRDEGIEQPVIRIGADYGGPIQAMGETSLFCPAGKKLSDLCLFALEKGLSGLEFAYGIPGSVGGAVYMNAGAYGGEMKDVVTAVHYLDRGGNRRTLQRDGLSFSYRHSVFCGLEMSGCCITGADFLLKRGNRDQIRAEMDDILERRKTKQPLEYPSAGSTFKRPEGAFASALIDQCGLKGLTVGGAQVSEKHAGFVINSQNATCSDILELVARVQKTVKDKTGFQLECEIKLVP